MAYDEEGNQTSVTDPLGRTITKTYDALGRLTSVTEPDEGGVHQNHDLQLRRRR